MSETRVYYGDNLTKEQRSRTMRAVKSRDTAPELALRKALRQIGLTGYRIDVRDVPGRPDVTFARRQLAVFVDGGYWHGRADRVRPGRSEYWDTKIQRTVDRDRRTDLALRENGWKVLRLWDDEVLRDPNAAARRVARRMLARPTAEFFAGIGLVGKALEESGFEVVFANDIDPVKRSLFAANGDVSKFVWGDIRLVNGADVPHVELATASFPCTDLSLAGNRNGLTSIAQGQQVEDLVQWIRGEGWTLQPTVKLELAERHIEAITARLMSYNVISMQNRGLVPNHEASAVKIYAAELNQRIQDTALRIGGLRGQLMRPSSASGGADKGSAANRYLMAKGKYTRSYLQAVASTIAGGTSEINRNIIATRGLGLPRD